MNFSASEEIFTGSRKQIFQPKTLDINALVADFIKMLQRMVGEDVELMTILKADIALIKGDPPDAISTIAAPSGPSNYDRNPGRA